MVYARLDYISVLKEYIDDLGDVLPLCLLEGATGTIADGMPQRMEGGPLPPNKGVSRCTQNSLELSGSCDNEATPLADEASAVLSPPPL